MRLRVELLLNASCLAHPHIKFTRRAMRLSARIFLIVNELGQLNEEMRLLFIHEVAGSLLEDRNLFMGLPNLHSVSVHGVLVAANSSFIGAWR